MVVVVADKELFCSSDTCIIPTNHYEEHQILKNAVSPAVYMV